MEWIGIGIGIDSLLGFRSGFHSRYLWKALPFCPCCVFQTKKRSAAAVSLLPTSRAGMLGADLYSQVVLTYSTESYLVIKKCEDNNWELPCNQELQGQPCQPDSQVCKEMSWSYVETYFGLQGRKTLAMSTNSQISVSSCVKNVVISIQMKSIALFCIAISTSYGFVYE